MCLLWIAGYAGFSNIPFFPTTYPGIKNIYAIGNKEFQRQTALRMGIPKSHYCDSREGQVGKWLMEHTGHSGAEVFFECMRSPSHGMDGNRHRLQHGRLLIRYTIRQFYQISFRHSHIWKGAAGKSLYGWKDRSRQQSYCRTKRECGF